MGEMNFEQKGIVKAVGTALQEVGQSAVGMCVATPGGRFHVRWDEGGSATALGQLAFFAEFLEVSGLFSRWKESCPTNYSSPNAPTVVNILGTLAALDTGWAAALCARDRAAWRRRRARAPRHDQDRQRRKPAPRTGASGPRTGQALP
jgi:hypothetical protein